MTEQLPITKSKRGRKPLGDAPMTPAERQRRRREALRTEGDRHFLLRLNGQNQEWVEILAKSNGISESKALHGLLEVSLDRYVRVMECCERLKVLGATDAEIQAFMQTHFLPPLPSLDDLELPRPDKNRGNDDKTGVSTSR